MDFGLTGKKAMVGGASTGLGRAVAERLAAEGADVAICARTLDTLRTTADAIAASHEVQVFPIAADLATAEGADQFYSEAVEAMGQVDILVHNTGGPPSADFFDLDDSDWQSAYDLLLASSVRMLRLVLPGMQQRKWGRVVHITSVTVKEPWPALILSNVMRVGVVSLAKTLSQQVASDGVTINCLAPGTFGTDRLGVLADKLAAKEGVAKEEVLQRMANASPMHRTGDPGELADAAAFLCSEQAAFITGITLPVDGGRLQGLM
jgi:3-oxoacyl-[acyl-carrier protein] reductase